MSAITDANILAIVRDLTAMTVGTKTASGGATPVALSATEIANNHATIISAKADTNGTPLNTAVVIIGDSTLASTAACQGLQLVPTDYKGYQVELPAHKIYIVAADESETQIVCFAALIKPEPVH